MKTFTINGNTFPVKPIDYNAICDMADMGADLLNSKRSNDMLILRAYVAYCAGVTADVAGELVNRHIIDGGTLTDITDKFIEEVNNSDFFQALKAKAETQVSESDSKEKKPKK